MSSLHPLTVKTLVALGLAVTLAKRWATATPGLQQAVSAVRLLRWFAWPVEHEWSMYAALGRANGRCLLAVLRAHHVVLGCFLGLMPLRRFLAARD